MHTMPDSRFQPPSFGKRLMMACAVLVLTTTAVWAIRGENPFVLGGTDSADDDGPLTAYSPAEEEHVPHGVDPNRLDVMAKYFEPGDHEDNYLTRGADSGRGVAHLHGKRACASGCAANQHPTPDLLKKEFQRLMALYAQEPISEASEGLEHLLYYGRQSWLYVDLLGTEPLDNERAEFLRGELKRQHALVELRVVDEHGVVRVWNKPTRVPLDLRYGFEFETKEFQRIVESTGTVKRVGLYHLWQRI
jgi:hypothetical protein